MGLTDTRGFAVRAIALLAAVATISCGDDESSGDGDGSGGAGGGGGSGGEGGGSTIAGCDVVLEPGDDDTAALQTALIEIQSGQTLCLAAGAYTLTKEVSLTAPNVTVRGAGDAVDDVVLDFGGQTEGDDGLVVTADGFTIENMWIKNTPGNGIVVSNSKDVTFRKLKVTWDAGSVTENGAYSIYPNKCENVLIEECEVVGAADAGIYVGQGSTAIVRDNIVYGNVAGIELENTSISEVYGNHAYDNTVGIFLPVLPNLQRKEGKTHLIRDNTIEDNNRANFGEEGSTIATVPPGVGILLVSADDIEIRDNTITGNDTSGVGIFSHDTFLLLVDGAKADPETDGYPDRNYIHGNTFMNNGMKPDGVASIFMQPTLEDIIWDGAVRTDAAALQLCLGTSDLPSFRMLNISEGFSNQSTDTTAHECELPPLSGVMF